MNLEIYTKLILIAEIFLIFILPVILIRLKIIPFKYRMHTLIIITMGVIASILIHGWNVEAIGLNINDPLQHFKEYIIFTIVFAITLKLILSRLGKHRLKPQYKKYKAIISGATQELMFRGFLFALLTELTHNIIIILTVNTLLFALIHTIYSNKPADIIIITIGGLIISTMYLIYPNLILIMVAHILFNYIAVSSGYYIEEKVHVQKA